MYAHNNPHSQQPPTTANGPSLLATLFMRVDCQSLRCVYGNFFYCCCCCCIGIHVCMYALSVAMQCCVPILLCCCSCCSCCCHLCLPLVVAGASATFTLTLSRLYVCLCAFEYLLAHNPLLAVLVRIYGDCLYIS